MRFCKNSSKNLPLRISSSSNLSTRAFLLHNSSDKAKVLWYLLSTRILALSLKLLRLSAADSFKISKIRWFNRLSISKLNRFICMLSNLFNLCVSIRIDHLIQIGVRGSFNLSRELVRQVQVKNEHSLQKEKDLNQRLQPIIYSQIPAI